MICGQGKASENNDEGKTVSNIPYHSAVRSYIMISSGNVENNVVKYTDRSFAHGTSEAVAISAAIVYTIRHK